MSDLNLLLLGILFVAFLVLIELSAFRSQAAARRNKIAEEEIVREADFYDRGFRKPGRYIDGEYYAHGKYPKTRIGLLEYATLSIFALALLAKALGIH